MKTLTINTDQEHHLNCVLNADNDRIAENIHGVDEEFRADWENERTHNTQILALIAAAPEHGTQHIKLDEVRSILQPTPRAKAAQICQGGASNERKVAQCLVEAIDQCRAEKVDPKKDAATYLILHQLVHLLTGHDVQPHQDMGRTWLDCATEVGA